MDNKNKRTRHFIIVLCFGLIFATGASETIAYLAKITSDVSNSFIYATVSCKIEEEQFDGITKKNVTVKNTSNIDAYIRCKVVVNWENSQGDIYGIPPMEGSDYNINLNLGAGWIEKNGTYEYGQPVKPNESTPVLINECTVVQGKAPEGYKLAVNVLAEAIQSVPDLAKQQAWNN